VPTRTSQAAREFEAAAACGPVDSGDDDCGSVLDRSRDALAQAREIGRAVAISLECGDLV